MPTDRQHCADLIARAEIERSAGRGTEAARLYAEAAIKARAADDLELWSAAALGAASVQVFGAEPGSLPSMLYDVLVRTTDDAGRSRLAAALARCWVYAGETARAEQFSREALVRARASEVPALIANALDAALAVAWGPDDIAVRRDLASELADLAAHLSDPEARLQAHLWGLHVACEMLDVHGMHRQMRALEHLGEDDPRARFFADSRRAMFDLVQGRPETVPALCATATSAAQACNLPDAWMVTTSLGAYAAVQTGDHGAVVAVASVAEEFAVAEGIAAVQAEAAFWWVSAGELDRAAALIATFKGPVLELLPRDVNWLLTVQLVLEAALATGDLELIRQATGLLEVYPDRAVVNAGAVMFHGSTDDTLARAFEVLGRDAEAQVHRDRALRTYKRIGATWWHARLATSSTTSLAGPASGWYFCPVDGGVWLVGAGATPVAGLRGMTYLYELIKRPGEQVAALDLAARGGVLAEGGTGELIDRQALDAYRRRLAELEVELAESEDWGDLGRAEAARQERSALLDEIGRATGLGGRLRTGGSSQERARVAVKKAITAAIGRLSDVDESLARHLSTFVHTGVMCSYAPAPESQVAWLLVPAH